MKRLKFQNSIHGLLSWFLDPRSMALDQEGDHRPAAIANHIAACYRELGLPEPESPAVSKSGRPYDESAYLREDTEYRRMVASHMEFVRVRISEHLTHFFLHGSLATLDYEKGWSDVDTFMVIQQETVTNGRRLLALRALCLESWELFLKICPLQHHGYIVATESDLLCYPSHYMPPPVFDLSLAILQGQGPARFHVCPGDNGALRSLVERRDTLHRAMKDGVFRHHPKNGVYLEAGYRNAQDAMGQLFALLGYVMTVPAFLMDALGRPCHKRDSFNRAKPLFSKQAWEIVERATEVRRVWALKEGNVYQGNVVPDWIRSILGTDYLEASYRLLDEAVVLVEKRARSMTSNQTVPAGSWT